MNKQFRDMLLEHIKSISKTPQKEDKSLIFKDDVDTSTLSFDKALFSGMLSDEEKTGKPFFFEKFNDYTFKEIEDLVNNSIDAKNTEYSTLEKKYEIFNRENIIRGLICKGDDVVLYGPRDLRPAESCTMFALQIALAISIGYPVFLCPTQKSKVLYINCSLSEDSFGYLLEKQIKGRENFDKYAQTFVPLKLKSDYNFEEGKESLKEFIEKMNPDIIFFDNMDAIYKNTRNKELSVFLKELSGGRTIVRVYNEESLGLDAVIRDASVVIGLRKEKNTLILNNKDSAFITWGHVYFDYRKVLFYTKELSKSFYPIIKEENGIVPDVKDYGLNPPLP